MNENTLHTAPLHANKGLVLFPNTHLHWTVFCSFISVNHSHLPRTGSVLHLDCPSSSLCVLPHCYSNHFDSGDKVQSSRHWYSPVRLYGITTQAVMTGV